MAFWNKKKKAKKPMKGLLGIDLESKISAKDYQREKLPSMINLDKSEAPKKGLDDMSKEELEAHQLRSSIRASESEKETTWGESKGFLAKTKFISKFSFNWAHSTGAFFDILIVFIFASAGYASGFPLIISAFLGQVVWMIINLLPFVLGLFIYIIDMVIGIFGAGTELGVLAGAQSLLNITPVPDFIFSSMYQFSKGAFGAILNGFFGYMVIKGARAGKGFFKSLIHVSFVWVWISMVLMIVYTGYIPLVGPSPLGLCGVHQSANQMIGAPQISCDPYELGMQTERLAGKVESNNVLNEILSPFEIKTDLGVAYKSDRIESEYLVNEDPGSTLKNLKPFKPTYSSFEEADEVLAEPIILFANLEANTLFVDSEGDQNEIIVTLDPSIGADQCDCSLTATCIDIDEEAKDAFNSLLSGKRYEGDDVMGWCTEDWTCEIPGAESLGENKFVVQNRYNKQIKCTHDGLAIDRDKLTIQGYGSKDRERYGGLGRPFFVDFGVTYSTSAIATKQLFVIDREVVESQEDPMSYLNIEQSEVVSKSITDGKINFGIGLDQSIEYLVPTYDDDSSPNVILLGISVDNPRFSNGDVRNLVMTLDVYPDSQHVKFVCGVPDFDSNWNLRNECRVGETTGNFKFEGSEDGRYKFTLDSGRSSNEVLNNRLEQYYISMVVDSEILGRSLYQGIFVQSDLSYDFETTTDTQFRVAPTPIPN